MKNTLSLILLISFASCKSVTISQNIKGVYYKTGKDFKYTLSLSKDSSFTLIQKYFEVNSTCQGKWHYISADTILLQCAEEDLTAKLQRGYMTERERKIIILSKKKLRLEQVILKKQ